MKQPDWKECFSSISEYATDATTGALVNSAFNKAISIIVKTQEKQLVYLKSINHDVEALLHGPYQTAHLYLEEASQAYRNDTERIESLKKSKDKLMEALGQETKSIRRLFVMGDLAHVHYLLRLNSDAKYWYRKTISAAGEIKNEVNETLNNITGKKALCSIGFASGFLGLLASAVFPPVGWIAGAALFGSAGVGAHQEDKKEKIQESLLWPLMAYIEELESQIENVPD